MGVLEQFEEVYVCVRVWICVREREWVGVEAQCEEMCVCMCMCVYVCVCERESVCVPEQCEEVYVCVCVWLCV